MLFVSTANICRSPVAEALARHRTGASQRFTFTSAGFGSGGQPCPDPMVREAARRGVDLVPHRSRRIDSALVHDPDLVITMEARHLVDLAVGDPAVFAKSVPLMELARMLASGPLRLDEVLDRLADRDPNRYMGVASVDDVPDPYRRNARAYRQAVDLIDSLVGTVVDNLIAAPGPVVGDGAATHRSAGAAVDAGVRHGWGPGGEVVRTRRRSTGNSRVVGSTVAAPESLLLDLSRPRWSTRSQQARVIASASAKRTLDAVVGSVALLALVPVLVVLMAVIRLSSPGPALYRQARLGRSGRTFTCLKFRTMHCDAGDRFHQLIERNPGLRSVRKATRRRLSRAVAASTLARESACFCATYASAHVLAM